MPREPLRALVAPSARYVGIDVQDADKFGYDNADATHFDGRSISAADESFDHFLCTEVLEHVADPARLVSEMHRVLKTGGTGIVTLPWSARFHYIPHDYHRFTPSALETMFNAFSSVAILPRGTDITVIASKIVVVFLRAFASEGSRFSCSRALAASAFKPLVAGALAIGHLSLSRG